VSVQPLCSSKGRPLTAGHRSGALHTQGKTPGREVGQLHTPQNMQVTRAVSHNRSQWTLSVHDCGGSWRAGEGVGDDVADVGESEFETPRRTYRIDFLVAIRRTRAETVVL